MDEDQVFTITLAGDVDYARKDELDRLAADFETSTASVARVEMVGVTFLDSRGLGFLVRLRNAADARSGQVQVVAPPEQVTNLLGLVNLDGRFEVVDS